MLDSLTGVTALPVIPLVIDEDALDGANRLSCRGQIGSDLPTAFNTKESHMSGIIGIASTGNALPDVLQGLQQLADIGHPHCALVLHGRQGQTPSPPRLHRHRRAQSAAAWLQQLREGTLDNAALELPLHAHGNQLMNRLNDLHGSVALGHAADAESTGPKAWQHTLPQLSHGPKADLNTPAHVAVVVHGPLQASARLREALIERDYRFKTDSIAELLAHLIDAAHQNNPVQALQRALSLLQGEACVGVLFHDQPERVFAMQCGAPLHVAVGSDLLTWASAREALPPGLKALPDWPHNQVLEVQTSPHGITHHLHA